MSDQKYKEEDIVWDEPDVSADIVWDEPDPAIDPGSDMESVVSAQQAQDESTPKSPFRKSPQELWEDVKSAANTANAAASNIVTGGFRDEIAGATQGLYEWGKQYIAGGGDPSTLTENYKKYRNMNRDYDQQARQDNPNLYDATQFVTGAAALPITGIPALAAAGAVSGVGNSEAELLDGEVGQVLSDAEDGALIGAASGVDGKAL
jgi:hypothetical protein